MRSSMVPSEDAIVATDSELMDIDAQLVADNLAYIKQHTLAVDTLDFNGCIEEQLLVHIPFGIYDAVAVAGLQFGCHRAGALVYLDAVLVVNVSHVCHHLEWHGNSLGR